MTYKQYFKFTFLGIGFAPGSTWWILTFDDGTRWSKLGLGFYLRY